MSDAKKQSNAKMELRVNMNHRPDTPLPNQTDVEQGLQWAVQDYEDNIRRSGSTEAIKTVQFKETSPRKRPMSAPNR